MNRRNMPGFTAETSLYKANEHFHSAQLRGNASASVRPQLGRGLGLGVEENCEAYCARIANECTYKCDFFDYRCRNQCDDVFTVCMSGCGWHPGVIHDVVRF